MHWSIGVSIDLVHQPIPCRAVWDAGRWGMQGKWFDPPSVPRTPRVVTRSLVAISCFYPKVNLPGKPWDHKMCLRHIIWSLGQTLVCTVVSPASYLCLCRYGEVHLDQILCISGYQPRICTGCHHLQSMPPQPVQLATEAVGDAPVAYHNYL